MLTLAVPAALLLIPVPLLARFLPARPAVGAAMLLPSDISRVGVPRLPPRRRRQLWLAAGAWILLVLALAQPQQVQMVPDRSASGRTIMIVLDMSGSMETPDFVIGGQTVTRLAAVKTVASDFIHARTGDRFGLVVFGDRAFLASPPSFDLNAVTQSLNEAQIGLSGRSTNISDGLGLALKRLEADPSPSDVIVLLSDGRDTANLLDPAQVARLADERGVRIHTVALGPEDLETRPAARDAVDLATLRAIAAAAGGQTFRVRSTQDLRQMAETLDRLEPNPTDRPPVPHLRALWIWPAIAALLLALAHGALARE